MLCPSRLDITVWPSSKSIQFLHLAIFQGSDCSIADEYILHRFIGAIVMRSSGHLSLGLMLWLLYMLCVHYTVHSTQYITLVSISPNLRAQGREHPGCHLKFTKAHMLTQSRATLKKH